MQGKLSTVDEGDMFDFLCVCELRWIIQKGANLGLQWNINSVKFCSRVLSSLPHLRSVTRDISSLEYTENQLNYIKKQYNLSLLDARLLILNPRKLPRRNC